MGFDDPGMYGTTGTTYESGTYNYQGYDSWDDFPSRISNAHRVVLNHDSFLFSDMGFPPSYFHQIFQKSSNFSAFFFWGGVVAPPFR